MDIINSSSNHKCIRSYPPFKLRYLTHRQCLTVLFSLLMLQLILFNYLFYLYRIQLTNDAKKQAIGYYGNCPLNVKNISLSSVVTKNETVVYKYPLTDSTEIAMEIKSVNDTSYKWFISKRDQFLNIGKEETPIYANDTAICHLNESSLGPITVVQDDLDLEWVEKQHPDVKLGGFYAPSHCRSPHRVAIIVPYRDRKRNLHIFLFYIHRFLKKQLLEYRIFVVEQYGTGMWNKGTLYNLAYLEIQRFGTWDCLIFHDVDTIPEHEGIIYGCSKIPTHMTVAVDKYNYTLPYDNIFGGVTALTPEQYETVNGYSNIYWNWGGEDDDMYIRLTLQNYTVTRYNASLARYVALNHISNEIGEDRYTLMYFAKRFKMYKHEGLKSTNYTLISVTKNKLYTHLLAEVNPNKIKTHSKIVLQQIVNRYGCPIKIRSVNSRLIRNYRNWWNKKIR